MRRFADGSAEQPATFADSSAEQPVTEGNLLAESLASTDLPWTSPKLWLASPPASPTEPVAARPESTPAAQSFYATRTEAAIQTLPPPPPPPPPQAHAEQPETLRSAAQPALNIKRDIFAPLNALCVRNEQIPRTQHDGRLLWIPWPPLAGFRDNIASAVPTFYPDEPDPNQGDKPRLDVLFTMHDGSWVRYHPSAEPIWSHGPLPTDAMTQRYNRARKIARKRDAEGG